MTPKHQAWKRLDFMHVFDDQNLSKKILETHNVKYHINSLRIGVKKKFNISTVFTVLPLYQFIFKVEKRI